MPELPDIEAYLSALRGRVLGRSIEALALNSPFLLRTVDPPLGRIVGKEVLDLRRIGKRIALCLSDELFLVVHLMVAGRLHWRRAGARPPGKTALLVLRFPEGVLFLTEAGKKKRASLHLIQGEPALQAIDPGGIDVLNATFAEFSRVLRTENHTLKRSLTDPRLFSGIGNAYSDEILHAARLSPIAMSQRISEPEIRRLHAAVRSTLIQWSDRLQHETGDGFPEKVTAFRPEMAVHGKYGQACPVCQTTVQRIRYADNETNYCPRCQTGGRLLADRALSRLLKKDWPRTIEELESQTRKMKTGGRSAAL